MRPNTKFIIAAAVAVAAATLAACSSDSGNGGGGGDPEVTITSPADGASVQVPFTLEWDSTVPLGQPDTGKDHVHVYVDGNSDDYTVVGGTEVQIEDLPPGEHTIEISLQHADHSPVGPKSATMVTVGGGSGSTPSPDDSGNSDDSGGGGGGGY